jgi:uncharacterized protein with HEPN domain
MPRSVAAYLVDIVDACDAIDTVLADVDLPTCQQQRATRSAVEREFILIGEAVSSIRRLRPEIADGISDSRMIVGFRNLLAHDYAAVDDEAVLGFATDDLPLRRRECTELLRHLQGAD